MAYFGLEPLSASYLTDNFSGNGSTVAFTLSRAPVSASSVVITISGVKQAASTYGVSGTTLTFSAAPPSGTNNIEVLHLGVQPDTVVLPSYRTITEFTATSGQTTFSPASYTVGFIDVFRNGVKLGTADFTATNGTSVVLNNACAVGDLVRFEGFLITSFNNAIPNTAGAVGASLLATGAAATNIGAGGVTQSMIGNNVAGTGPAFSAKTNTAQTITNGSFTQVAFQLEEFDTNSNFASNTFVPTVPGYYQFTFNVKASATSTLSRFIVSVYKNGATTGRQWDCDLDSGAAWFVGGSRLLYCNGTTDAITLYVYMEGTGTLTIGSNDDNTNYFSGVLVRSA